MPCTVLDSLRPITVLPSRDLSRCGTCLDRPQAACSATPLEPACDSKGRQVARSTALPARRRPLRSAALRALLQARHGHLPHKPGGKRGACSRVPRRPHPPADRARALRCGRPGAAGPLRLSPGRWLRVQHRSAGRRVCPGVVLVIAVAQRDPDRAVALEAAAEGELPHAIAAPHALLRLHIAPCVPGRRQGRLGHDRRIGLHARRMRPRAVHGGTPGGSRPKLMRARPALCLGNVQAALP